MPVVTPSITDVHVNAPLTNISLAFIQADENFVADKVFPTIPVKKASDIYFTYDRGEFNRDEMKERAPATESEGGTYDIAQDTYSARVRAYHRNIPEEVRDNADEPIDLDREATLYVTLKERINREVNWVTAFFTDGDPGDIWTFIADGNATPTAAGSFDPTSSSDNKKDFWDVASSTPIEDIRQGKRFVGEATGFRPNTLTMSRPVFDTLIDHADIVGRLDRGQTEGPAIVQRDALAALFELDQVLVMDGIKNTAKKGQDADHSFIGGKHALLSYRPPSPGIMTPSAGYTFAWTGRLGATRVGTRIKRWDIEAIEATRVEMQSFYDQKRVSEDLGYMFTAIVQ